MSRLAMSPDVKRLFDEGRALKDVFAVISNNVEYVPHLEYGTKRMAPKGMIRKHLREYRSMIDAEMREALAQYGLNVKKAAEAGVTMAALRVMRSIADRTPVDTGRAKSGWVATLPGGRIVKSDRVSGKGKRPKRKRRR